MAETIPGISSFHARSTSGLKNSEVLYGAKVWLILNVVTCVGTVAHQLLSLDVEEAPTYCAVPSL